MSQNREKIHGIAEFGMILFGYFSMGLVLFYILILSKGQYHSDCTDTIMWAQAALDGHSLINKDFYYAALLPFGGQLLMMPFVAVFGVSVRAQIYAMVLFAVLFMAAIYAMTRAMKLKFIWIYIMMPSVLFTVSASAKLREIFWEHIIYYSLGALSLMAGVALVLKCIAVMSDKTPFRRQIKWYLLFFVFTMLVCANGMQSVTMYGLPVLAALVAERFFDFKVKLFSWENIKRYLLAFIMVLGIVAGLLLGKYVNGGVKAGYADAYSSFSNSSEWVNNFLKYFSVMFELLGVRVKTNMLIFSSDGIRNLLRIIFAIVLMVIPVVMAFLYYRFEELSYRIMILVHQFTTLLILMGWTFGKLNSASWRLSPILVTSAILCVLFVRWLMSRVDYSRLAAVILIPFIIMFGIVSGEIFTMKKQTEDNAKLTGLIRCLKSNGLEYGYGSFWQANAVTLLSDSGVKIRCVKIDEEGCKIRYYQTNRHWYGEVTGYDRYFVVYTEDEFEKYFDDSDGYEKMLACDGFIIIVYEDNVF